MISGEEGHSDAVGVRRRSAQPLQAVPGGSRGNDSARSVARNTTHCATTIVIG